MKQFFTFETTNKIKNEKVKRIYFAAPLFSAAEITYNQAFSEELNNAGYITFLPQRECKNKKLTEIFEICKAGIDKADVVVAIMDGADADSGTCWECGYAFAKNIPVIIVRSDFRNSGDTKGFNAMLYYSAAGVVESETDYFAQTITTLKRLFSDK